LDVFTHELNETVMELGEVQISASGGQASFEVKLDQAASIKLIVQDHLGRPLYENRYNLEAGIQVLGFPVQNWAEGSYYAWLHFQNNTKMQPFSLAARKKSIGKSFLSHMKLF
jgi:hypothetical protein